MNKCSVECCDRPFYAKGFCKMHHHQMWQFGEIRDRNRHKPNKFLIYPDKCEIECYDRFSKITGHAIIDLEDVEKCKPYKWHFNSGYVVGYILGNGVTPKVLLHNLVLNHIPIKGVDTDHKDRNTWNNRKNNLRLCSHSENACNVGKKKNNTSGYKGVFWDKKHLGWYAQITKCGVIYRSKFYTVPEKAAEEYNRMAEELHGEFALVNKIGIKRRTKQVPE